MDRLAEICSILDDLEQRSALTVDELRGLQAELRGLARRARDGQLEGVGNVVTVLTTIVGYAGRDGVIEGAIVDRAAQAAKADELVAELGSPGRTVTRLPSTAAMAATRPANAAPVVTGAEARVFSLLDKEYQTLDEFASTIIDAHHDVMAAVDGVLEGSQPFRQRLGRFSRGAFPAERRLTGSVEDDSTKTMRVLNDAWSPDRWSGPEGEALVASGGFCAPAMPDYEIPMISGTHRPVHDYLPAFQADRGQVISVTPPALGAVATSTAQTTGSAVSVWPNSVDATPGGAVKPFQTITCPANVTTAAQALVEQLKVGNFEAQAFPELVKTWMGLAAAAWARRAEGQLLQLIHNNVTAQATTPQVLGAARDFIPYIGQAAALYRWRNRMPQDAKLRLLTATIVIGQTSADINRQQPGDGLESLEWGEAELRSAIAAKDLNATFYEDVPDSVSAAVRARYEGAQGNTELKEFPLTVISYLFHEGAFALLDAGTLDLGIVRDSTLDSTNDYKFFTESFESVIPHVIEAVEITHTLAPLGTAPALVSDAGAYFGAAS